MYDSLVTIVVVGNIAVDLGLTVVEWVGEVCRLQIVVGKE